MKIAYLGPEGSYSHLAAKTFLKSERAAENDLSECIPFRNFPEVVLALSADKVDAAVLPIENSLQGGVLQNLDLLQTAEDLYAVKESVLRIDHRLVYKEGVKLSEVGRVYSHRQALDQCAGFLTKALPFASLRETESTGFGLVKAMEDSTGKSAAIVGAHTENLGKGFVISDECISDEKQNFTHFLLVKKGKKNIPQKSDRVFLSAVCPHRPGSLMELLHIIEKYGVNMTKIESRPVRNRPGEYRFFIEADCNVADETTQTMIKEIGENTLECKFLGAYVKD